MPTKRDRLQLNVVIAEPGYEKALAEFALEAFEKFRPRVPAYREPLLRTFIDAAQIRKPRAAWALYR